MFVVVVWFCRSCSLAFLISAYLINLMHHFLLHWLICFGGYLFVHTPIFFLKNTWTFCVFLSVPHLVDNYAKIADERGRNLMCDRTLPSRLVAFTSATQWQKLIIRLRLCHKGFTSLRRPKRSLRILCVASSINDLWKQITNNIWKT